MSLLEYSVALLAILLLRYYSKRRRLPPFAPGPKGLPVIGNVLDLPKSHEWFTFARWAQECESDIININALGTNIVILHSLKATNDLLDKCSAIFSSRPQFPMINELMGWDFLFASMPYTEKWRKRRRLFQHSFPATKPNLYQPQQRTYIRRLLPQLIDGKHHYRSALRHFVGGLAINMAYGLNIKTENDPFVELAEHAINLLNEASAPGKYLVDVVPWLKYVPEWFPGADFKRKAKEWYKVTRKFRDTPYQAAKRELASATAGPSFVAMCLDNLAGSPQEQAEMEEEIMDTASIFFAGVTDTIMSTVLSFILMITIHPEIQKKVQEELDRVIGHDRLPDFSDIPRLPFLGAVMRESLRWQPPAPLAVPHSSTEDDVYEGYYIPKGSILIPNIWGITHDERNYSDPFTFRPERFLTKDGTALDPNILDPYKVVFGFGRRICPGRHIAGSLFFIIVASMLSTMNISKPVDAEGRTVEPKMEWAAALIPLPVPFDVVITPRSKKAESLIQAEATSAFSS